MLSESLVTILHNYSHNFLGNIPISIKPMLYCTGLGLISFIFGNVPQANLSWEWIFRRDKKTSIFCQRQVVER